MRSTSLKILVVGCAIAGVLSLAACKHQVVREVVTVDTGCIAFEAIRPTAQDIEVISDDLVDQLLVHNEIGHRRCGWKVRSAEAAEPGKPP